MVNRTMFSAANTMSQLQSKLDIIGNNLANTNTSGYKAKNATFGELLYQQFNNDKADNAPRQTALGVRIGVGAQIAQTQLVTKQGSLQTTDRFLDFAFTDENLFFNVQMNNHQLNGEPEQIVWTRQGDFQLSVNDDGTSNLVDENGSYVLDADGNPIQFRGELEDVRMDNNGVMQVAYKDGGTERIAFGITKINRPEVLSHLSGTYFTLPENAVDLDLNIDEILEDLVGNNRNQIALENGMLEQSNVDMSKEMSDLMQTQRSYQFNARTVSMADQMMGLVNSIR